MLFPIAHGKFMKIDCDLLKPHTHTHTHTSHSYNYKQYTNSIPNPQYGKTKTFSPAYLP